MTKQLKATCDNCKQTTLINFKVMHHDNDIQETYFECDNCNKRYTCYVMDSEVRELQEKMKRIRLKDQNLEHLETLQEQINSRMTDLKRELINVTN